MPSYVVTGAGRGLGYAFVHDLSADPENIVVGLVRDLAQTEEKAAKEGLKNVTFLEANIVDRPSLKRAAEKVKEMTGGSLDYLINNAALHSDATTLGTLADFDDDPTVLEKDLLDNFRINVFGTINTVNVFMPLIQKGKVKKVIAISSGMADPNFINDWEVGDNAPYSISKGALNITVAKYNARYKKEGILFLAISPGVVDTGNKTQGNPELARKIKNYAPHFKGPMHSKDSVKMVMEVVDNASVEKGDGGTFISHFGNQQWV